MFLNHMKTIHKFDDHYVSLYGLAFTHETRLNQKLEEMIGRENHHLIDLGKQLSGGHIAFKTTSRYIDFHVELLRKSVHPHMSHLAESGLDIYIKNHGKWVFYRSVMPASSQDTYEQRVDFMFQDYKEVMIYLPLYNGIKEFNMHFDDQSMIEPLHVNYLKKGLFYGTSITQGACASRPGMTYTSIISRRLNHLIYNFGFSGQGLGEQTIVEMMASIHNLDYVVIDYEANAGAVNKLEQTLPLMIKIFRKTYPKLPIIIVTRVKTALSNIDGKIEEKRQYLLDFQKTLVDSLKDDYLYLIDGTHIFNTSIDEKTVDGVHFNDIGMKTYADHLVERLDQILNMKGH